ncbi:PspC domain-containing protein [Streptococcus intermedius]|nr:PspC domain-containing protein [Streptococcus intermedius]
MIMKTQFYKLHRNSAISGVLAGLSDKFGLDVGLVRFLFVLFTIFNFGLGIIIYVILAAVMPYKEDVEEEMYGTGPRKRKEAEAIKEEDGWFW